MTSPVIILGSGGHAKVLTDALNLRRVQVLGMTDKAQDCWNKQVLGVQVLGDDSVLRRYPPGSVLLVNGLGSIDCATLNRRKELFDNMKAKGYSFATVIHPSAIVAGDVVIGEGAQIMAGAVIQAGSRIGMNSIVNTRVCIDHDCTVGDHAHLAPGAVLSGAVEISGSAHIGCGAVLIQGIRVGAGSLVAAGSVVVTNLPEAARVAGVPAKELPR